MNCSVPGKLTAKLSRLNIKINCLKAEIRIMKENKDEQIKEQKQVKKRETNISEEVIALITRLKN